MPAAQDHTIPCVVDMVSCLWFTYADVCTHFVSRGVLLFTLSILHKHNSVTVYLAMVRLYVTFVTAVQTDCVSHTAPRFEWEVHCLIQI